MSLPAESVAAACNAWFWVSDDAVTVETDEYLLVRSPDYFTHPLSLAWFRPAGGPGGRGPGAGLAARVAAVLDRARQFGLPRLYWHVRLDSPAGVPDLLTARGATVAETLDVLALDLRPGVPAFPAPARDVEVRWATDLGTARDASAVASAVFGGTVPPEERIARNASQYAASVPAGEGGVVVGYAGGKAAGTAGLMVADGVARLWGGSVVEAARGQGVYRALLATRLEYGVARGATMALVKARVETSGPILRRAGFRPYGQELAFDVPLG
jgi:GNAT superfamily N-acetyltransferase